MLSFRSYEQARMVADSREQHPQVADKKGVIAGGSRQPMHVPQELRWGC